MSKVDAQRAMKAARHARTPAPATPAPARPASARPAPARPAAGAPVGDPGAEAGTTTATATSAGSAGTPPSVAVAPAGAEVLCGHRNMGGKECRRPVGHAEKSHRYS